MEATVVILTKIDLDQEILNPKISITTTITRVTIRSTTIRARSIDTEMS